MGQPYIGINQHSIDFLPNTVYKYHNKVADKLKMYDKKNLPSSLPGFKNDTYICAFKSFSICWFGERLLV
jgi:hypothetical protein